jgi:hypothetical protein
MTRTPLHNRSQSEGKEPGRPPLANKIIKEKTPLSSQALTDSVDQHLFDVMRSLNLAVAVVAQARDQRFSDPKTMVKSRSVHEAMLHLKEAAIQLDLLRRSLPKE